MYVQLNGLAVLMTASSGGVLSYEVCKLGHSEAVVVGRPGREHEVWRTLDVTC